MKEDLYLRVKNFIRREGLIRPGESVAAGVSGGADSVCLLLLLLDLSREEQFSLQAVHVHHGLREAADADQDYVRRLCAGEGIPCICVRADAAASAAAWGCGVEEAGRRIRYDTFEKVCRALEEERGGRWLAAAAHHLEDQAETVLFHLCRGTGLRGARGMEPRSGRIIRPLLEETRGSIEDWLRERGVSWRTDETNADTAYTRNYLRREILPRLREGVNPASAEHIARFAQTAQAAEEYLQAREEEALGRCLEDPQRIPEGNASIASAARVALRVSALREEDPYMLGRVLYRCLAACTGTRRDLETVHIESLRKLTGEKEGGRLSMPGRVTALRRDGLLLLFRETEEPAQEDPVQEDPSFPFSAGEYEILLLDYDGNPEAIPRNRYTKWFDYDKIGAFPIFRTRQAGDRMTLRTAAGPEEKIRKKTARIMLDEKVPVHLRDRIVFPCAGQETLWIPGLRMGDAYRITPETRKILQIRWVPPAADGCVE